jgi:hypothetical protein
MPGHSYSGSSAAGNPAAVFPPTPVAALNVNPGFFQLQVLIAACTAGRPTFEGWSSSTGTGTPDSNPGEWDPVAGEGDFDDATHYGSLFDIIDLFFIGRARYGLNVSGWSNVGAA